MRSTWTDTRLDKFATDVDHRFDTVDHRFDTVDHRFDRVDDRFDKVDDRFNEADRRLDKLDVDLRDIKSEISANSRSMLQFCGVMVAAQMATVATLIATQA